MTYFVDELPARRDRDLFEFGASTSEAMGAAFRQSFVETPLSAMRRIKELGAAERGALPAGQFYADDVRRLSQGLPVERGPDTPRLTAEEARARVAEAGLPLTVPEDGIQEGALDILMQRKREELERQFLVASAPSSSFPLQLLAGFAAQAFDPLNIAVSFVPVVGQSRYSAILARAGTAGSRFGARAGIGAVEGAVGAALVEPLVLLASAQDQADYGMADALTNIAFGTILGGGLHSIGGAVADALRPGRATPRPSPAAESRPEPPTVTTRQLLSDDPAEALLALSAKQMREDVNATAYQRAFDEAIPVIRAELEEVAKGKLPNVADLKALEASIGKQLDGLDGTFRQKAKAFQKERLSRKDAERAARDAIADERLTLTTQREEVRAALEQNRTAELARADLARIRKGELPARYQAQVLERADAIKAGVTRRPLATAVQMAARDVASAAPFAVRHAALRTAVAQAMSGRPVDVEDLFRLQSEPAQALESIRQKAVTKPLDPEAEAASARADELLQSVKDDVAALEESLNSDMALAREFAEQRGIALDDEIKLADEMAAQAQTYAKAWRAAAVCSLGN